MQGNERPVQEEQRKETEKENKARRICDARFLPGRHHGLRGSPQQVVCVVCGAVGTMGTMGTVKVVDAMHALDNALDVLDALGRTRHCGRCRQKQTGRVDRCFAAVHV